MQINKRSRSIIFHYIHSTRVPSSVFKLESSPTLELEILQIGQQEYVAS